MSSLQIIIQNFYHKKLRKQAIDHLDESNQVVARNFRGEYLAAGLGKYKDFLNEQKKVGTWGTYIEAIALAEKYNVNLVVTPVAHGIKQEPICLYRSNDSDAKTIHLYNNDNTHWYVDSQTQGDGNCLYNAFAQALFNLKLIKLEDNDNTESLSSIKSVDEGPIRDLSIFSRNYQEDVRVQQEAIQLAISKAPKATEREQDFDQEKARIGKLSPEEQKQIADDHAYALRIAREEGLQMVAPDNCSLKTKL
ncbi:Predicted cysteine protease (OTU family) [Legionella busanensis]|uniref:Predicted cysteine protease (OTU family) n=1 Tax=Legionella busanensis TaxID=190655 RepID=A0A378JPI9_9GAMM|nr:OTU domain-containing protein [Legionella busanensis]STX52109.1 Predicted cysteine protease (OTU family) [Legionella busanensis]